MTLVFVDCEAGPAPVSPYFLREFGAVVYTPLSHPSRAGDWRTSPAGPSFRGLNDSKETFESFADWLLEVCHNQRAIFVSDNPAYDFQWINYNFWRHLGMNPFGHSARRISDFYAGLRGNFYDTQNWKRLRRTPHDHNPVHDALGNVEAFDSLLHLTEGTVPRVEIRSQ